MIYVRRSEMLGTYISLFRLDPRCIHKNINIDLAICALECPLGALLWKVIYLVSIDEKVVDAVRMCGGIVRLQRKDLCSTAVCVVQQHA